MDHNQFAEALVAYVLKSKAQPQIHRMRLLPVYRRYHQGLFRLLPAQKVGVEYATQLEALRVIAPMLAAVPQTHDDDVENFGWSLAALERHTESSVKTGIGVLSRQLRVLRAEKTIYPLIIGMQKNHISINWTQFIVDGIFWNRNSFYDKWYPQYLFARTKTT